jgi:starch synthase|nr:glycogen synthase GlgA [Kofleriaceae bacterium]
MNVLHVASEVGPFAQSGGLADVLAGLPLALADSHGLDVGVVVPLYRGVAARVAAAGLVLDPGVPMQLAVGPYSFPAAMRVARRGRVSIGFVDCAPLFDRDGGLYGPTQASEFGDNHLRFGALGRAALQAGPILLGGEPDVLHVHDWQGGPAAIYARLAKLPVSIVATIHNLAFRGIFGKHVMAELGLPWSIFTAGNLEFYDQVSLLKGGLAAADVVTTVSPSYAREILTPARGEALDGFLRWEVRRLVGIVNGIDTAAWDPATDRALTAHFSRDDVHGKAMCRAELLAELGLRAEPGDAVLGVVARMTDQKGLDLVADLAPDLARMGARVIVLGAGEPALEDRFRWLAEVFREHVAVRVGFDADLARRIYAGSDAFVMPSRFEPCGLGQLYAMRYGAIPVVHAVGGLRDTVRDPGDGELRKGHGTGVRFEPATAAALAGAVERVVKLLRDDGARVALRRSAMSRDSSWTASAAQYVQLYRSLRV